MSRKLVFVLALFSALLPVISSPLSDASNDLDSTYNDPKADFDIPAISVEDARPIDNTYYVDADHLFSPYIDDDKD